MGRATTRGTHSNSPPRARVRRGRPVDLHKRRAILAAAQQVFFGADPRRLNIETIARTAGVSKATVYAQFGSLTAVLRAVIEEHREDMARALRTLPESGTDLRASLVAFGDALLDFLTSPAAVALQRMLAARVGARARLGRLVYAEGPLALRRRLANILEAEQRQGRLRRHDALVVAEQLLGMWQGLLVPGQVMGGVPRPSRTERRRRVRAAVDTILRAYSV